MINIGIDWSHTPHAVCFLNEAGAVVTHLTVPHSPDGFLKLDTTRQQLGVAAAACRVGLETAHNLLIDFLWAKGYTQVYVIPPSVVKGTRGRYRHSGARTDESDARLLADVLRTDQARFQAWRPDDLLTRQMRAKVSLLAYLTQQTTRFANRLRAVLVRYYPAATGPDYNQVSVTQYDAVGNVAAVTQFYGTALQRTTSTQHAVRLDEREPQWAALRHANRHVQRAGLL